jgi:inorganic pyrophosphatase
VGGIQAVDGGEADDKIVAVLDRDAIHSDAHDIEELPEILVERLRHYFSTYKLTVGQKSAMVIEQTYGAEQAFRVIEASMRDYEEMFEGTVAGAVEI